MKSISPRMPPISLPALFASFSVCEAMSCPWAKTAPAVVYAPAEAPVAAPLADLPAPLLVVDPNTTTRKTPRSNIHSIISTGLLLSRNRRKGAK